MVAVLTAVGGALVGFYAREVWNMLKYIKRSVGELRVSQEQSEQPKTGFAEPMTPAEFAASMDEERIAFLNQGKQ